MSCREDRLGILKTTRKTSSHQGNWAGPSHWGYLHNSTNHSLTSHYQSPLHQDHLSHQASTAVTTQYIASWLSFLPTILPSLQTVSLSALQPQWAIQRLPRIPASVPPFMFGNLLPTSRSLPLRLRTSVSPSSMLARVFPSWNSWTSCCRVCRMSRHPRVVRGRFIGV